MKPLTDLQCAIISVVHQTDPERTFEPIQYRFVGSEGKAAQRMVRNGLLRPDKAPNTYKVTAKGERAYKATETARKAP